jgi:hypothetical protein
MDMEAASMDTLRAMAAMPAFAASVSDRRLALLATASPQSKMTTSGHACQTRLQISTNAPGGFCSMHGPSMSGALLILSGFV